MFGNWFTVTSTVVNVDVQPVNVFVPVTVYVVLFIGDTAVVFVVAPVGCQLYVSAPVANKVTAVPAQVTVLVVRICGKEFTLIVTVSVPLVQLDVAPTIVYVVGVVGLRVNVPVVVCCGLVNV